MDFLREHLAEEYGDMIGFVELAVEELLVNVVRYAYAEGSAPAPEVPPTSGVCWSLDSDMQHGRHSLSLRLDPRLGRAFDPFLEAPKPDISLSAEDRISADSAYIWSETFPRITATAEPMARIP